MTNKSNKNSQYVQSLVDFILDTKPYHTKLTEIVEEYRFNDDLHVSFLEALNSYTKMDSHWPYDYYSNGNAAQNITTLKRVVDPDFMSVPHLVGRDENTDLALVPFSYDKKSFDGFSASNVTIQDIVQRQLIESVDYSTSQGSFQFQIKQLKNANGEFRPLWQTTLDDGVVAAATAAVREFALDLDNPNSANRRIRALLDDIQTAVQVAGGHREVQLALTGSINYDPAMEPTADSLMGIINRPALPRSYELLLVALATPNASGVMVDLSPHDIAWYKLEFQKNSPPLYFGQYGDIAQYESGQAQYAKTFSGEFIAVTNFLALTESIEVYSFTNTALTPTRYTVSGSQYGLIGYFNAGESFTSDIVSFSTSIITTPDALDEFSVNPTRRIVISPDVPMETWNLIKTNPLAYTRPLFRGVRYGYLQSSTGELHSVTMLNDLLDSSAYVLTCRDAQTFILTKRGDPTVQRIVPVGVPYQDVDFAFTIVAGTDAFTPGDKFFLTVENKPAEIIDLDLGFSYDLDPYDDDTLLQPDGTPYGFAYDTRFTEYDFRLMKLKINQNARDGRAWRISPARLGGETLQTTIPSPRGDLNLYLADQFAVEYSDDGFITAGIAGYVQTGADFSEATLGISFTLAPASRPFILAVGRDDTQQVSGGDVISFRVSNPAPHLTDVANLESPRVPTLLMRACDFHYTQPGDYVVRFTSATDYEISATTPFSVVLPPVPVSLNAGNSYFGNELHWSILPTSPFQAGDVFTFTVFDRKPTYLVHGSVTGFTDPAVPGEYYTNGKIGFTIPLPKYSVYWQNNLVDTPITVELREDVEDCELIWSATPFGYTVTRTDNLEMQIAPGGVYRDSQITVQLNGYAESEFRISIVGSSFTLFNTRDVQIINPPLARQPEPDNIVWVTKSHQDTLSIALAPGHVNLSGLRPITIDPRFIGTSVNSQIPLSNTSPETAILGSWIPTQTKRFDIGDSPAEYSDSVTRVEYRSPVTGELIGTLNTPAIDTSTFAWDNDFRHKYLPLNASATLLVANQGWRDHVRVQMKESVKLLIGSGALEDDFMFHDDINVLTEEQFNMDIHAVWEDAINPVLRDDQWDGFMPGYDNLPFDEETPDGAYDVGMPPDLFSMLARYDLSSEQRRAIMSQWDFFLLDGEVPTTQAQIDYMIAQIAANPNADIIHAQGFGIPLQGLGVDVLDTTPDSDVATGIVDALSVVTREVGNGFARSVGGSVMEISNITPGAAASTYADTQSFADFPVSLTTFSQTTKRKKWDIEVADGQYVECVWVDGEEVKLIRGDTGLYIQWDTARSGVAVIQSRIVPERYRVKPISSTKPVIYVWYRHTPEPELLRLEKVGDWWEFSLSSTNECKLIYR